MVDKIRTYYCNKILPLVYDNSLSYYEAICKLVDYCNSLNDEISNIYKLIAEIIGNVSPETGEAYLDFEMFGAIGDGITNDSEAIKKCFETANKTGISVICKPKKKYLLDAISQVVNVNFDGSNSTFILPPMGTVFTTIKGDDMALSSNTIGTNGMLGTSTTNKFFTIETDIDVGERLNAGGRHEVYCQTMCTDMNNYFVNTPWYQETISDKSWKLRNVMEWQTHITFKNFNVETTGSTYPVMFRIFRNNITIENVHVGRGIKADSGAELIFLKDTGNIEIKNVTNNNIQDSINVYGYLIGMSYVTNVKITGVKAVNGWGAMGSHFVSNTTFEYCDTNRIDNHYGWFGYFNVLNCHIKNPYGSHGFISFGGGYGQLNINNCTIKKTDNSVADYIRIRTDLPLFFDSDVNITNCRFYGYTKGGRIIETNLSRGMANLHNAGLRVNINNVFCADCNYIVLFEGPEEFANLVELNLSNIDINCATSGIVSEFRKYEDRSQFYKIKSLNCNGVRISSFEGLDNNSIISSGINTFIINSRIQGRVPDNFGMCENLILCNNYLNETTGVFNCMNGCVTGNIINGVTWNPSAGENNKSLTISGNTLTAEGATLETKKNWLSFTKGM